MSYILNNIFLVLAVVIFVVFVRVNVVKKQNLSIRTQIFQKNFS